MDSEKFKLFDFSQEKVRVLHYTWIAFFLTFFVWFNMAPLKTAMVESFDFLTGKNFKALLLCNVALTIPARIVVGALVDKYGPRVIFSGLIAYDNQKLIKLAEQIRDQETLSRIAVVGALSLYLDFVNLFLSLLRLIGERR